jgi:V8-like Glu-specific endopeptidase
MSEELVKNVYLSYGTGTLIGKAVVLTAYHVISHFLNYKKFIKGSIQFELKTNSFKPIDVIRIRYSEQFDWALLFL